MNLPDNLKYTKDHEWLLLDDEIATVGITDYAQGELGDVVFVDLPAVGKTVAAGESFGSIEAVKAVSELLSPVSGSVIEVNPAIEKTPEIVNSDPYGNGWMVKIKLSSSADLSSLLDATGYRALVGK
jgi:glycine cleavage system H protein